MKKFTFALAAATALIAAPALAADLRPMTAKAPPMAAYAPVPIWSGFYIGIHGGYGWGDAEYNNNAPGYLIPGLAGTRFDHEIDGGKVGGHVGFNWQWNQIVLGLEGSGTYTEIERTVTSPFFGTDTFSTELRALGTITPRLGFAAGNALFYVKGGVAFGDIETRATSFVAGAPVFVEASDTRVGWTVGGGLEYAVTPNWIFGIEGNYYDFGSIDVRDNVRLVSNGAVVPGALFSNNYDVDVNAISVMGRVSYKFGGAAPVVARY
jgi:outer membrane immunogenic protein